MKSKIAIPHGRVSLHLPRPSQRADRCTCLLVICVSSIRVFGCLSPANQAPEPRRESAATSASLADIEGFTPAELARRTADAYRNAESLEYEARVTQSNYPAEIECKVKHGLEQRVQLEVYDHGKLIYELSKAPATGGVRVVEKNHQGREQADYVVAREEVASGKWDMRCNRDIWGCIFGGELNSSIGTESRRASFYQEIISTAESVDLVQFDNQPCYFVKTTRLPNVDETLWIGAKTFTVVRWKQIVGGVERDRVFSHVVLRKGGDMLTSRQR